jgi:hypothetical protein
MPGQQTAQRTRDVPHFWQRVLGFTLMAGWYAFLLIAGIILLYDAVKSAAIGGAIWSKLERGRVLPGEFGYWPGAGFQVVLGIMLIVVSFWIGRSRLKKVFKRCFLT